MNITTRVSLSAMMFFQYFIWGAWYVILGTYLLARLDASAVQVGSAYATFSIGAIISPFFMGMVADRFFAAQKVLAVLHLLGALILWLLSNVSDIEHFWWLLLFYTLLYTPTISLANSIAFNQMQNSGKEFPSVRVLGTIGWIVAGLIISMTGIETTAIPFRLAAVCSVLLGVFSLTLPHTPPNESERKSMLALIGADALYLLKDRSFLLFFIASILICIPLSFYYNFTHAFLSDIGLSNTASKMSLGQASEFVFMLVIPFLFAKLGVKKMLQIAVACWVLRYLLFAFGDTGAGVWMLYGGILLHGICYDFFFVTGQIYTDHKAGPRVRSAAQGLLTFSTYGIGMLIGSYLSGLLTEQHAKVPGDIFSYNWEMVWIIPASIAFCIFCLITILFKEKTT